MKNILSILLALIVLNVYGQDEYYRTIDWKFYPDNVVKLTDSTYTLDALPFDFNDPGSITREVGNYVVDFIGHRYSVIGNTSSTLTVLDIYKTGQAPQTEQIARCYLSVGNGKAEYIGSVDYSTLDESAKWKLNGADNELLWSKMLKNPVKNIEFDTSHVDYNTSPGVLSWDKEEKTLHFTVEGGRISINKELFDYYADATYGFLEDGHVVSVVDFIGGVSAVDYTDATSSFSASTCIGMVTHVNGDVRVTSKGRVHDLNTAGLIEGLPVYVDATNPGHFTQVIPTKPNYIIFVGIVETAHATEGVINVNIISVPRLDNLSNVSVNTAKIGNVLGYDGENWVPVLGPAAIVGNAETYYLDGTSSFADNYTLSITPSLYAEVQNTKPVRLSTQPQFFERFVSGALGKDSIIGGIWTFDIFGSTSNVSGLNKIQFRVNKRVAQTGITGTFTGTGPTRTFTVTGGSPFVPGDVNASVLLANLIETPNQTGWITTYISPTSVTVQVTDPTYVNQSNVPLSAIYYYMFNTETVDINSTIPNEYETTVVQPTFYLNPTDRLVLALFAYTDAAAERDITLYYGGSENFTHFHTPVSTSLEVVDEPYSQLNFDGGANMTEGTSQDDFYDYNHISDNDDDGKIDRADFAVPGFIITDAFGVLGVDQNVYKQKGDSINSSGYATQYDLTQMLGASSTSKYKVYQANHLLTAGEAIYLNDKFYKAKANNITTSDVIGVVTDVISVDTFVYAASGEIAGSYTLGENYFLSNSIAGAIIPEPVYSVGDIRQFIGTGTKDGKLLLEIDLGYEMQSQDIGGGGSYSDEQAQDATGAMVSGNTETGIDISYDDASNKLNFVATDASASNEYNTSISWVDGTNTITILDGSGNKSVVITGFIESEVDGSISNEGSLTVNAGTANTSIINSNTSGQTGVTLTVDGTNLGISETGNNITLSNLLPDRVVSLINSTGINISGAYPDFTITNTAPDTYGAVIKGDLTENVTGLELNATRQVIGGAAQISMTTGYEIPTTTQVGNIHASGSDNQDLSLTGNTLSLTEDVTTVDLTPYVNPDISGYQQDLDTTTFDATLHDLATGLATKEPANSNIQLHITNDADLNITNEGSLTVGTGASNTSLIQSNTNGSTVVTLEAGSNITLSEAGNTITIASASGAGSTDLSVSGITSPLTLNSSTGTDVTFTAGSGITLTGTSSDITITSSAGGGNVSKVGTPVDNQVGVWTGNGTIEGDADLVFDGTKLTVVKAYITTPTAGVADYDKFLVLDATGTEIKTRTGAELVSDIGALTSEVDGSITNEGSLSVDAGTSVTSIINSNTSGQTGVTLTVDGTNLGISETGNNITLSNLKPDQTVSITGGGINNVTGTYPNFTVTGTEVDGNVTNEIEVADEVYNATNFNGGVVFAVSQDDFYDFNHIADTDDDGLPNKVDLSSAGFVKTDASGVITVDGNTYLTGPVGATGDIQYNNAGTLGGFGDWNGSILTVSGSGGNAVKADYQINTVQNGTKTANWTHDAKLGDIGAYRVNLASSTISIHNLSSGMQGTIFLNFVTTTPTAITVNTFSDAGTTGLTEIVIGAAVGFAINKTTSITYTCANDGTNTYVYLVYGKE